MLAHNPFSDISSTVSPLLMQAYVAAMIFLAAVGTLYDMAHKRSAEYFFANWRKARKGGNRTTGAAALVSLAVQTAAEGLVSGEFCSTRRRIAHLLTMYGFLAYAITTAIMVFFYADSGTATPSILPALWHAGAFMVCLGGYWFWFFIRVDVAAEGNSPFRVVRADLFILSLLASTTLALAWSWMEAGGNPWANFALVLYVLATTVLFASVPWSKFSHMFYKPAAAFQKKVEDANGWRSNLPPPADKPAGLGSTRRQPSHY
jgi:predicted small integral membrane protein